MKKLPTPSGVVPDELRFEPNRWPANGWTAETTPASVRAELAFSPTLASVVVTRQYNQKSVGPSDLTEGVALIDERIAKVKRGDLSAADEMLTAQAGTLDAIFSELARKASQHMGNNLQVTETYLRMAMKAQSQCRATWEAIAAIKNPPVVYARQANFSNGPQQVNNVVRTSNPENTPTELMEQQHGQRVDFGAQAQTVGTDPQLEAVGEVHRTSLE